MVDNVLVSRDGFCNAATVVYAHGHDLADPLISPVYGDVHGFPPAILTTGTRGLLLSNTIRVHRKLREAGVDAQLEVFEGESHAQYEFNDQAPETKEAFGENQYLLRQTSRPLTSSNLPRTQNAPLRSPIQRGNPGCQQRYSLPKGARVLCLIIQAQCRQHGVTSGLMAGYACRERDPPHVLNDDVPVLSVQ